MAVIDTRISSNTVTYLGWRDIPEMESRNYQYNVSMNGKPVFVDAKNPGVSVDMKDKPVLNAYRFSRQNKIFYNTYNLLRGDDDWDPMGIKNIVLAAEKQSGKVLTNLPVQVLVSPTKVTIESGRNSFIKGEGEQVW